MLNDYTMKKVVGSKDQVSIFEASDYFDLILTSEEDRKDELESILEGTNKEILLKNVTLELTKQELMDILPEYIDDE